MLTTSLSFSNTFFTGTFRGGLFSTTLGFDSSFSFFFNARAFCLVDLCGLAEFSLCSGATASAAQFTFFDAIELSNGAGLLFGVTVSLCALPKGI